MSVLGGVLTIMGEMRAYARVRSYNMNLEFLTCSAGSLNLVELQLQNLALACAHSFVG